jgi:hypothetical protein
VAKGACFAKSTWTRTSWTRKGVYARVSAQDGRTEKDGRELGQEAVGADAAAKAYCKRVVAQGRTSGCEEIEYVGRSWNYILGWESAIQGLVIGG